MTILTIGWTATRWVLIALAATIAMMLASAQGHAQAVYPNPGAAADALVEAVATSDDQALARVLGRDYRSLVPDGVSQDDIYAFLGAAAQQRTLMAGAGNAVLLSVGAHGWTFPVPIVPTAQGWHFDLAAGRREIARRAVGRNELAAIDVLFQLATAQQEYIARGAGQGYARKLVSARGATDGLYWPAAEGEPASPVGPAAWAMLPDTPAADAFYGYRFSIVPISASRYAMLAWPAQPRKSGVHMFVYLSSSRMLERVSDGRMPTASSLNALFDGVVGDWREIAL